MATVKVTREMADDALRGVDWTAVDATTDEEIARQIARNSDAAPIFSDTELVWATFGKHVKRLW